MKNYTEILVPRQSDSDWEIPVVDKDGAPVDLTQYEPDGVGVESNIVLVLYNPDQTVVAKYSIKTSAGWKDLSITGGDNNRLSFTLDSDDTNLARPAKVLYEIRIQKEDALQADDQYDLIVRDIYLCTITDSITSHLTLP